MNKEYRKKISIIIPVYNIEKYIKQCIDSVLNQKYKNLEIIIINDGSTDNSKQICEMMQKLDSRIKLINIENGGLSKARNTGIKNATGEYIMFLDGDDFIQENCILDIATIIEKNNVDMVVGKMIYFYRDRVKVDNFKFKVEKYKMKKGTEVLKYFFLDIQENMWSACRSVYKKEFLIKNNFYFLEGITSEDLELIPRIYVKAQNIILYDIPFYNYRQQREGSIINTMNSKKFYDILEIIRKYQLYLDTVNIDVELKNLFLSKLANIYCDYLVLVEYIKKEEKKLVFKEMQKKRNILKYCDRKKGKIVKISIEILGIKITSKVYKCAKELSLLFK